MKMQKQIKILVINLFFCLLIAGCGDGVGAQDATTQPKDMIHLKRFDIIDHQGFKKPIAVATFLAPSNWKLEGGVQWNPNTQCTMEITKMQARAINPDGKVAFEIFPRYTAMWVGDNMINRLTAEKGCIVARPITNEEFIKNLFIPKFRQGARVRSIEHLRELTNTLLQEQRKAQQSMLQQLNARLSLDVSLTRIEYSKVGQQMEELVLSALQRTDMPTSNGYGQQITMSLTEALLVLTFKSPKGQLEKNKKLLDTILNSYRTNPNYMQALQRVRNNMDRIAMKGITDRINIQQQMNRELSAVYDKGIDSWKRRMASEDQFQSKLIQSIHGTESYSDPQNSGVVWDLNAGYNNVWKTPNDEFILTNDINFNPNISSGDSQNWLRMKKTK